MAYLCWFRLKLLRHQRLVVRFCAVVFPRCLLRELSIPAPVFPPNKINQVDFGLNGWYSELSDSFSLIKHGRVLAGNDRSFHMAYLNNLSSLFHACSFWDLWSWHHEDTRFRRWTLFFARYPSWGQEHIVECILRFGQLYISVCFLSWFKILYLNNWAVNIKIWILILLLIWS